MPHLLPHIIGEEYYPPRKVRKYVDKNIQDLVIKLNDIPFIQTSYSCGGHLRLDNGIVVAPCLDFFCDINGRFVSEDIRINALAFVESFGYIIAECGHRIPRGIINYSLWDTESEEEYQEALSDIFSNVRPQFRWNKFGGCSFNGSYIERYHFAHTEDGMSAARALRNYHHGLLERIGNLVDLTKQ